LSASILWVRDLSGALVEDLVAAGIRRRLYAGVSAVQYVVRKLFSPRFDIRTFDAPRTT
jgi:hypothetical protein